MDSLGSELVSQLKGPIKVDVARPMGTSILQLQATSSDPNVSQKFLDALIAQYLDFKKQTRLSTTEDLLASLNDALSQREDSLKEDQDKWAGFQKTNNVPLAEEEARASSLYLADLKTQVQKLMLDRQLLEQGISSAPLPASTTN